MDKQILGLVKSLLVVTVMMCCGMGTLRAMQLQGSVMPEEGWNAATDTFIMKSRERMQQVRTTLGRPTVGLVLSGGGAMGASEVGAIKYLEEMGIPIDLVCGTSIGGLLGGLYAIGYDSEELRQIFTTQDWNIILSDNVDNRYMPYNIQEYRAKTLYSIKLGRNQEISENYALPSGLIDGFNVNNLFSSLTVGYEGPISFSELPIPYACVSADLVSCKAYNWVDGSISTAMRSTMSIPGLFSPVKTDNMILVDGGVRNNFPADMARAMGADYIIGIDLHDARAGYKDVTHLGNVVQQLVAMFSRDVYDDNLELADVVIKPQLEGFSMLSFNSKAVDNLVDIGYKAAQAKESELLELKRVIGNSLSSRRVAEAINIANRPVKVKSVMFEGLDQDESLMMLEMAAVDTTQALDRKKIEAIMGTLQACGYFSEIKYTLQGRNEPYDLVFECRKAPAHKLGFGLRGDTEEGVSVYVNCGLNANKALGSKLELDAKINQNLQARLKYSYVSNKLPVINLETSFSNVNMKLGSLGGSYKLNLHYQSHTEALYMSLDNWNRFQLRLGVQNYWIKFYETDILAIMMGNRQTEDYVGLFADGHFRTLNDPYFPTKGTDFYVEGRYEFAKLFYSVGSVPMWRVALKYKSVIPAGQKISVIPSVNAVANSLTETENEDDFSVTLSSYNYMGGSIDKRYHRNHIAFFGVNRAIAANNYLIAGTLELRYKFANKWYGSLLSGYYRGSDHIENFFDSVNDNGDDTGGKVSSFYAFGTELSYKTKMGPLKCNIHWGSSLSWGAYLSLGYDF